MADAKWQPAGPPTQGQPVTTPAVQATVAGIKADNRQRKADRRAARRAS